jgi:hypothetical protein
MADDSKSEFGGHSSSALECKHELMERMASVASALATGVLAGAMILIRLVLVPFWRRGATSGFKPWFIENSPRLRNVMVPLGTVAAATTTANALITHRRRAVLAAAAAVGVGLVTMTVNEPLNARFAGPHPIDPADLDRWIRWHDIRVALGLIAAWASADPVQPERKVERSSYIAMVTGGKSRSDDHAVGKPKEATWSCTTSHWSPRSGLLDGLDLELEADLLAHHDAAPFECGVPGDPKSLRSTSVVAEKPAG